MTGRPKILYPQSLRVLVLRPPGGSGDENVLEVACSRLSDTCRAVIKSRRRWFRWLLWTRLPAAFIGKQKKNRTKRNPQLFDSPPTCCIYPATWNLSDIPVHVPVTEDGKKRAFFSHSFSILLNIMMARLFFLQRGSKLFIYQLMAYKHGSK